MYFSVPLGQMLPTGTYRTFNQDVEPDPHDEKSLISDPLKTFAGPKHSKTHARNEKS